MDNKIARKCKVIAVANQKGGTGKSVSAIQLSAGLVKLGYKVLIIDADPQSSITKNLGFRDSSMFNQSLADVIKKIVSEEEFDPRKGIIDHKEGMFILPGTQALENVEASLITVMDRERILKEYIDTIRMDFDYIIIDCRGTLGLLTQNALSAADSVLIPTESDLSAADGFTELVKTIYRIKKKINPELEIEGILFVNVEKRTNYCKEMMKLLKDTYSEDIKFFEKEIPHTVKVQECAAVGSSMFVYAPKVEATEAYMSLVKEVVSHE